jgi:hypothetical protein
VIYFPHVRHAVTSGAAFLICSLASNHATGADADPNGWKVSLTAAADAGYDTNPTQGGIQSPNRTHGDPDTFVEGSASARLTLPTGPLPVVIANRADDREYSHQEADDHALIHSSIEVPIALGPATLAPKAAVDNEWYNHAYYDTTTRLGLRWTQDWSTAWSTDLVPFISRSTYRPPNRGEDGTEIGFETSATWWIPGRLTVRSLSIDAGLSHTDAHAIANSRTQALLGVNLDVRLGWHIDGLLDLEWLPTRYHSPVAGRRDARSDRTFEIDASLTRPIVEELEAQLTLAITNDQSNRPAQQYHELVVSAGIVWTWD